MPTPDDTARAPAPDPTPHTNTTSSATPEAAQPEAPDISRYPRTESGRILPRWVALCDFVLRHFITDAPRDNTAEAHATLAAWRAAPQGSPRRRIWEAYCDGRGGRLAVYAVHNVAPETWATLAAWYSRSPRTMRQNIVRAILCGDIRLPDGLVVRVPSPSADGDDGCMVREHPDGGFSVHYDVWDSEASLFAPVPPQYAPVAPAEACPGGLHTDPRWAPPEAVEVDGMLARSRAFHEKWTVGYGHASVAEGAVVYLCVDGCSIYAAKALEEARIGASYTEKSSRYVDFKRAGFVSADELGVPHFTPEAGAYDAAMQAAFMAYEVAVKAYREAATKLPGGADASAAALNGWAFDRARDYLPCGARTGLAMTINARALAHHIARLRGPQQSPEVQFLGALVHDVAHRVCPSLVRHAGVVLRDGAVLKVMRNLGPVSTFVDAGDSDRYARRVGVHSLAIGGAPAFTREAEAAVYTLATAILDEVGAIPDGERVGGRDPAKLQAFAADVIAAWSADRGPHEGLSRAAEVVTVAVDGTIPYGAWRDVQRHRTLTVTRMPKPDFRTSDPDAPPYLVDPDAAVEGGVATPQDMTRWVGVAVAARRTLMAHIPGSPFRAYVAPVPPRPGTFPRPGGLGANYDTGDADMDACDYDSIDALQAAHPDLAPVDVGAHTPASGMGALITYATPLGSGVRVRISGNLRAWAHFVELRSRREGHDDYRILAQRIGESLMRAFPGLHLRVDTQPRTFARK